MPRRKRFTYKNRARAHARWQTYRQGLDWLRISNDQPGDFYWTGTPEFAELLRRGLVDNFERVTPKGKKVRARLLRTDPMTQVAA